MHVLAVLKRPVQACDHRDVLSVRLEWLHRRRPLETVYARLLIEPPLLFGFVRIKSADKARDCRLIFAREKLPAYNPVRDIHDHQFFVRFFALLGSRCAGLGHGMQKRQQHCAAARLEEFTS